MTKLRSSQMIRMSRKMKNSMTEWWEQTKVQHLVEDKPCHEVVPIGKDQMIRKCNNNNNPTNNGAQGTGPKLQVRILPPRVATLKILRIQPMPLLLPKTTLHFKCPNASDQTSPEDLSPEVWNPDKRSKKLIMRTILQWGSKNLISTNWYPQNRKINSWLMVGWRWYWNRVRYWHPQQTSSSAQLIRVSKIALVWRGLSSIRRGRRSSKNAKNGSKISESHQFAGV